MSSNYGGGGSCDGGAALEEEEPIKLNKDEAILDALRASCTAVAVELSAPAIGRLEACVAAVHADHMVRLSELVLVPLHAAIRRQGATDDTVTAALRCMSAVLRRG